MLQSESRSLGGPQEVAAAELLRHVSRVRARGWCDGTSGNFSVVLDHDPARLLITPSGRDKGELQTEDLLLIDERGRSLSHLEVEPSAETGLHLTLVERLRPGAILHTHSQWGTLLSEAFLERGGLAVQGYEMLKGLEDVRSHEEKVFIPVLENSQDIPALAAELQRLLDQQPRLHGFLIAGHGLYTWGRTVAEAYRHVEIFEFLFSLVGPRARLIPFDGVS